MRRLRAQGNALSTGNQLPAPSKALSQLPPPKQQVQQHGTIFKHGPRPVVWGVCACGARPRAPRRASFGPIGLPSSILTLLSHPFPAVWAYRQNPRSQRDADASGASAAPRNMGVEPTSPPLSLLVFHQIAFCPILSWCLPLNLSAERRLLQLTSATHTLASRWRRLSHSNTSLLWPAGETCSCRSLVHTHRP